MRRAGALVLVALLCLLASAPSLAREVEAAGTAPVVFRWAPASGPVAGYALYVSRNGGPFLRNPRSPLDASVRGAVVHGSVGETLRVRVAAVDSSGNEGPPSPVSEPVELVAASGSHEPGSPPTARALVGRTRAVFEWEPVAGPVEGYAVHVSRNGRPFRRREGALLAPDERRAEIGGDFGDTVRVRVTAVRPDGSEAPPFEPSRPVVFLEDAVAGGATSPGPPGAGTDALVWGGDGTGTPRGWSQEVSFSDVPTTVGLSGHIEEPVVLAGPPTLNGHEEGVVQLRDVTRYGFSAAFREWTNLTGAHWEERASFLVLPAGGGTLPDGTQWEAGRLPLEGARSWTRRGFDRTFDGRPALFLTLQTSKGAVPVAARARAVDASGFEAALFPEESHTGDVPRETVGYLALHAPAGSGRLSAGDTGIPFFLRRLSVSSQPAPFLGSVLHLQEDRTVDHERSHGPELVDVLALGPHVFAQDVSSREADVVAARKRAPPEAGGFEWGTIPAVDERWHTVPFGSAFRDPVLVVGSPGANDEGPVLARVREVGPRGFEVRLEEWVYQDGVHGREALRYVVAERGIGSVGGHLVIEASSVETEALLEEGGTPVSFAWDFGETPAVFAGLTTQRGPQPVLARVFGRHPGGFRVALQEEEGRSDGHAPERVDWIAIRPGSAEPAPERSLRVLETWGDGLWRRRYRTLPEAPGPEEPLTALAGVVSAAGADPVSPRVARSGRAVELLLQEELSADDEAFHAVEDVVLFVAD